MRLFNATRAARKFSEVLDEAQRAPVAIYRHDRPCAVVLDHELFRAYQAAYDAAREERYLDMLEKALAELADDKLGRGQRTAAAARRLAAGVEKT
ncbi:MAG: type II toxin-antitoxin system Phd/YefM family antitoxin [Parvularculaceae bacterium]